jgi:type II secretion system protein G
MKKFARRVQGGFTLIELLIVVAIIGIIAAIAIPNLLNAIDRAKQKRTMADVRSIGTATEAYAVDVNFYPRNVTSLTVVEGTGGTNLETHITPVFIRAIPGQDGWGGNILYQSSANGQEYTIISYGKDNSRSTTSAGKTTDFSCDIIFQVGGFIAWPEGIQT